MEDIDFGSNQTEDEQLNYIMNSLYSPNTANNHLHEQHQEHGDESDHSSSDVGEQVAQQLEPNGALSEQEQKERALKAAADVRERGISLTAAAKHHGIGRRRVQTAFRGGAQKRGRKPILDEEGEKELNRRLTERTLALDAPSARKAGEQLFEEVRKELAPNKYAVDPTTRQARYKYLRRLGVVTVKKADVKNSARQKAYMAIRNAISMAAMMRCIAQKVHPRLIFSSDDFSVHLNGWDQKPAVLTKKEAQKVMRELNMGISKVADGGKRRVVTFNCTISFYGVVCKVLRFCDANFKTLNKLPKIFSMGNNFFVVLSNPTMKDVDVVKTMYWCCIIPCAQAVQNKAIADAFGPLTELIYSQSTSDSQVMEVEVDEDMLKRLEAESSAFQDEDAPDTVPHDDEENDDLVEENESEVEGETELEMEDADKGESANTTSKSSATYIAANHIRAGDMAAARAHLSQYARPLLQPTQNTPAPASATTSSSSSSSSSSSASATAPDSEETRARARFKYFCLLFDGAISQIDALLNKVNKRCIKHNICAEMAKSPGGESMAFASNDTGDMHLSSHTNMHEAMRGYREYADHDGNNWLQLRAYLEDHLDPDSFRTLWKCITAAPYVIDDAFKSTSLQKAFANAGSLVVKKDGTVSPSDEVILSKCPAFQKMSDQQCEFVLSTLPEFSRIMEKEGYIPEEEFERILSAQDDIDNTTPKTGKPLNLMSTSRQRACLVNSPGWAQHLQFVQDYNEEKEYTKMLNAERREQKRLRDEAAQGEGERAPKTARITGQGTPCVNCACQRFKGDKAADRENPTKACKDWVKCKKKGCRVWRCPSQECAYYLDQHSAGCEKG